MLWIVMLATPFPYIATTAGWVTAEVGRQPWLVYGLFRTAEGSRPWSRPATAGSRTSGSWAFIFSWGSPTSS